MQLSAHQQNLEKFVGKWVAWSQDRSRIVAIALTLSDARTAARAAGEDDPVFDKVRRTDAWFVGTVV